MDSQSLSEEDIVASLILHRTGWSVWRSTVMLFPSTLGLSLISFTTWPTKWATWNTNFLNIPLTTHHHSMDGVKYTLHQTPILDTTLWMVLNYTRKRVSSEPCLGGRVRDSLPATYTFRMFLWSPEDIIVGQRLHVGSLTLLKSMNQSTGVSQFHQIVWCKHEREAGSKVLHNCPETAAETSCLRLMPCIDYPFYPFIQIICFAILEHKWAIGLNKEVCCCL